MKTDATRGQLDLLLLAVLTAGPAHGYAIIAALRDRSGGTFDLPEGSVYPALHRLEREGLVASTWDRDTGRRRRVYALTETGMVAGQERAAHWHRFARGIGAVLAWGVGPDREPRPGSPAKLNWEAAR